LLSLWQFSFWYAKAVCLVLLDHRGD